MGEDPLVGPLRMKLREDIAETDEGDGGQEKAVGRAVFIDFARGPTPEVSRAKKSRS